MNQFGFYFKELLVSLKQPLPAIVFSILLALIICLTAFVMKRIVNRSWLKEPEKIDKMIRFKMKLKNQEICRLRARLMRLKEKEMDLYNYIKAIKNFVNGTKI